MSGLADRRRNLSPTDLAPFEVNRDITENVVSTELRPIFISQGIAAHASGSAYLEAGDIKLHASVHGPQQVRGDFNDSAQIEVNVHVEKFAGVPEVADVEQSTADFVRASITPAIVLKEYPKSRFVISLVVLNGPSMGAHSLLAPAVNAVTMALVNAGVALHDMVTSVCVSKVGDSEIYVDAQLNDSTPGLTQVVASYSTAVNKLVSMLVTSEGAVTKPNLTLLLDRAGAVALQLREVLNSYLVEDYLANANRN